MYGHSYTYGIRDARTSLVCTGPVGAGCGGGRTRNEPGDGTRWCGVSGVRFLLSDMIMTSTGGVTGLPL